MSIDNKRILGIDITIGTKVYILEETQRYLLQIRNLKHEIRKKDIKPFVIFTPNPEIINYAQRDEKFKEIVTSAQINIPDGIGVVWALKKLYGLNAEKLSGADLMLDLCSMAEKEGFTVGLIGGREGIAVAALECLQKKYPNLKGWVMEGPDVTISNIKDPRPRPARGGQISKIKEQIIKKQIDILFVALGFPKQEYFIEEVKSQKLKVKSNKPLVLMAVGGTFDYLAGRVSRAPKWMRDIGLEWLYRLLREPYRLPRQIIGAEFFIRVLTSKCRSFY